MDEALPRPCANAFGLWPPPELVIVAPDYTYRHSGIRCLHLLCDRLNRLGVSAAVTSRVVDPRATTQQIDRTKLISALSMLNRSIVIYPEVTPGNPLRAKHVVRYLLNKPGFFTGIGMESYGTDDYFIHFAEEFRPAGLTSRLIRLPLVDTGVFMPPAPGCERKGFLVYSHRYRPDIEGFPDWIQDQTIISWETPRDPPRLANLYRCTRGLIVGERTTAIAEALHCHCPVIMLPHREFAYEPLFSYFGGYGLVLGFDRDGLIRATESAPAFPSHYAANSADIDGQILEFVADARRHFGLQRLRRA
jgi:O-antigen biosynthesis protein